MVSRAARSSGCSLSSSAARSSSNSTVLHRRAPGHGATPAVAREHLVARRQLAVQAAPAGKGVVEHDAEGLARGREPPLRLLLPAPHRAQHRSKQLNDLGGTKKARARSTSSRSRRTVTRPAQATQPSTNHPSGSALTSGARKLAFTHDNVPLPAHLRVPTHLEEDVTDEATGATHDDSTGVNDGTQDGNAVAVRGVPRRLH